MTVMHLCCSFLCGNCFLTFWEEGMGHGSFLTPQSFLFYWFWAMLFLFFNGGLLSEIPWLCFLPLLFVSIVLTWLNFSSILHSSSWVAACPGRLITPAHWSWTDPASSSSQFPAFFSDCPRCFPVALWGFPSLVHQMSQCSHLSPPVQALIRHTRPCVRLTLCFGLLVLRGLGLTLWHPALA